MCAIVQTHTNTDTPKKAQLAWTAVILEKINLMTILCTSCRCSNHWANVMAVNILTAKTHCGSVCYSNRYRNYSRKWSHSIDVGRGETPIKNSHANCLHRFHPFRFEFVLINSFFNCLSMTQLHLRNEQRKTFSQLLVINTFDYFFFVDRENTIWMYLR